MQNQFYENINTDEQEIKLTDYLNIITRYKWLVTLIFLSVFVLTIIYTARAPRIYKATSRVLLEERMTSDLLFSSFSNKASSINNNIQILQSNPVMKIAYRTLQKHPEFESFPISKIEGSPLIYLKEQMSVDTERETDILIINFESTSALEAKEAANAAAHALLQEDTDYARIEFRNTREFLADQLYENDNRLKLSEEELRIYKIEHGISILSEETQELIKQSSELSALYSDAKIELDVANNHLDFLNKELSMQDELLSDVNSVLSSPLLEQMKLEILELQSKYLNYLTKSGYSADHPELVSLNESIENAKAKLNEELQKIISIKAGSSDPLMYRAQLIEKIAAAQIDQNIKNSKVVSLQKAVEEYDKEMSLLPDTEIELARLTREYNINEKIYTMLIEKYEDAKIAEKSKIGNIRIVEEAIIPDKPIKPNKKMNMMIAIVLGLGLGIGAALLLHSLDSKIRTFDDVRKFVALPLLGTIPFIHVSDVDIDQIEELLPKSNEEEEKKLQDIRQQMEARLVTNYSPKSSIAEAFRILRTNIISKKKIGNPLTILVSSSGPKEGKSTIHSNLAITLAQMDARVILVDLDLRRPMVHNIFHLKKEKGISDFLMDKTSDMKSIIKRSSVPNLDLITSGHIPPNPSELLASSRMDEGLKILKENYDYILLDSPPIIAVTDSMVLAKKVDILTLVVRVGQADKHVIKRAKELMENIDLSITGAIINGIHPQKYYSSYEYNYYYYYYYGKEEEKKNTPKLFRKNKPVS
ncbi:MAG: polysaccharide biosynthesis tyrosine autokinase [Candidatus Cloacimonetes bacterium]|nr:polysaccharide biosynthesis tyrosine autokinase [Candidatus Cloacimonadota bacterium]